MKLFTILIGMFNPSKNKNQISKIIEKKVKIFSLELLPRITRAQSMDVLSSQSNLAGYRAVIDCVADTRSKHVEGDIEFIDRGEEGMVSLETISISEGMYFNIINFGRIWHPGQDNLDFLYEKGLAYLLIEIFTDINNNTTTYQDSDIHDIIYHAVNFAVGPISDPNFILSGLPVEEYNELRYEAT